MLHDFCFCLVTSNSSNEVNNIIIFMRRQVTNITRSMSVLFRVSELDFCRIVIVGSIQNNYIFGFLRMNGIPHRLTLLRVYLYYWDTIRPAVNAKRKQRGEYGKVKAMPA